jgi:hypothetical protein
VRCGERITDITIPLSAIFGFFSRAVPLRDRFPPRHGRGALGVTTDFKRLPALVDEHELTEANSIFFAADRAARVIGPTLGGIAIAAMGSIGAMWIAALAFIPTLAIFWRMPPVFNITPAERPLIRQKCQREIGEGFTTCGSTPSCAGSSWSCRWRTSAAWACGR